MAEYTSPGAPLRQSLLRQFDRCPQSAVWDAQNGDHSTPEQALGTALHLVAEHILRRLQATGAAQVTVDEAVKIMYEQVARPECPHLSDGALRDLRMLTVMLAAYEWESSRIVSVERRLFADIVCPDGQTRTVTSALDTVIADPPGGAVYVDFKSGFARPKAPRDGQWDREGGRPYLSDRGVFQLDCGGFLIMRNYPPVNRVTLREHHLRWGETREATLTRDELPAVEARLGVLLQRLDMTLAGEIEPEARLGSWCRPTCPRIADCPIPARARGEGAIGDADQAAEVGARFVVEDGQRDRDRQALKAWCQATGESVVAGDTTISVVGNRFTVEKGEV